MGVDIVPDTLHISEGHIEDADLISFLFQPGYCLPIQAAFLLPGSLFVPASVVEWYPATVPH
jgi:hypothetical protein